MDYTLYTDGGITENPGGIGSWGWVLKRRRQIGASGDGPDGQTSVETIARGFGCLGRYDALTNNVCEYEGLIQGLLWVLLHRVEREAPLVVRLDSQLVANQVTGHWRCHSPTLAAYLSRTRGLLRLFAATPAFEWIPRSENVEADALCALAVERYQGRPAGSAYWFSERFRRVGQQGGGYPCATLEELPRLNEG